MVRKVLVSTYGRAPRKLNVARKHLPHDRLVLVCDPGAEIGFIRTNEEERGTEFVPVLVDPYDFDECLDVCFKTLEGLKPRDIKVNISCGPKTLVGAMLFAAFHAGVEVYHCDVNARTGEELVIRLPTLLEFELRRRFSDDDWKIVRLLKKARRRGNLLKICGMKNGALDMTLTRLERDGVIQLENRKGVLWIVPTATGRFFSGQVPDNRK
jgi:hypothetical protein